MAIIYIGRRRTPKEYAAIIVARLVEMATEDAEQCRDCLIGLNGQESKPMTDSEHASVKDQVRKLQERVYRMLRYDPRTDTAVTVSSDGSISDEEIDDENEVLGGTHP